MKLRDDEVSERTGSRRDLFKSCAVRYGIKRRIVVSLTFERASTS